MSNYHKVMTIYADRGTQNSFKQAWEEFNSKRMGKVTQAEFLEYIVKITREHIPEFQK